MKYLKFLRTYVCLLLGFAAFTACTSDEEEALIPEGKGYVKLSLNADAGFQTKAVDESEYRDVNNYTVQIFKSGQDDGNPIIEGVYGEMDEKYPLVTGQYVLKAFMGEDKAVSADVLYFYGQNGFKVSEGQTVEVPVTCKPSSARINVVFDPTMDDYFSAYSVKIETEAQSPSSFDWTKETVGPIYFKVKEEEKVVFTVNLTNKENVTAKVDAVTYTLSPGNAKKITVKPHVNGGNLGISINIDDKPNDHNVDIEIPGEWL